MDCVRIPGLRKPRFERYLLSAAMFEFRGNPISAITWLFSFYSSFKIHLNLTLLLKASGLVGITEKKSYTNVTCKYQTKQRNLLDSTLCSCCSQVYFVFDRTIYKKCVFTANWRNWLTSETDHTWALHTTHHLTDPTRAFHTTHHLTYPTRALHTTTHHLTDPPGHYTSTPLTNISRF